MSRQNRRRESGSTPPVGSSRKTIGGSWRIAQPERQSLAPAAGQRPRELAFAAPQAGHLEHEIATSGETLAGQSVHPSEEGDVLIDGQRLVE